MGMSLSLYLKFGNQLIHRSNTSKKSFAKTGTSGMRDIIVWISGLSEARIIASFGEERDRRLGNLEFERRNYDRTFKSDLH